MKIVVAMDSFKGSLTAVQACDIVAEAIRSTIRDAVVVTKPMADGGEGTAMTLMAAAGGRWVEVEVVGPLPETQVAGGFVWLPQTHTAVVEMAVASGLPLLRPDQYNPLKTTTFGTGQLIHAAIEHGAEQVLLAIGGSATVDGGIGAAMALGWRFLKRDGHEIALGGGQLAEIDQIIPPQEETAAVVRVLCDVDNPLCGEHGAAHIYGPQKGATPEMVETLDAGLMHLAGLIRSQLGQNIKDLPGAGAAGGLAAGAISFLDGRLVSGVDEVIAQNRLREELADADWVITGEGRFDHQSLRGKVVSGVARAAREGGAKVAVIAGQVHLSREVYAQAGIEVALPCMTGSMTLDHALAHVETLLAEATRRFAGTHLPM
ncbi:MAG: glycerate kinase [Phycisphaerales bacterium]